MIESMVKEMLKTKDYERPKSRKALDRKGKRDFNLGKAQKCQKLMSKGHEWKKKEKEETKLKGKHT